MKPGVQKPHWNAPASMNASCTGSSSPRPSCSIVCDLGAVDERGEIEAARHGRAVDEDGAAAAQPLAAAFARAEQVEALLQQLDQRLVRRDVGRDAAGR